MEHVMWNGQMGAGMKGEQLIDSKRMVESLHKYLYSIENKR